MLPEMDSNQFENLYSSALFHKLSFHSSFLQLFVVLRDLQTLTLAHIYTNLHSRSFVQSHFLKPSCAVKPRQDSGVEDLEGR